MKRNRYVLALLIVILLFIIAHFIINSDYIKNKKQTFEDFAANSSMKSELFIQDESSDTLIHEEKQFKFTEVISKATSDNQYVNDYMDSLTEEMVDHYLDKAKAENEDKAKGLIVKSTVTTGSSGVKSIVSYGRYYTKGKKGFKEVDSLVKTAIISPKTGQELSNLQVLNINYKEKSSDYVVSYIKKHYDEKQLKTDWEKYLTVSEGNFNKLSIKNNGITYYFDRDTLLKPSKGAISVSVPSIIIGDSVRDEVLLRVIDPDMPMVAITYDDGPGDKSEKRIIKCLNENNAVATFFYVGSRVKKFNYNAKEAYEIGCEIGNHSWSHPQLTKLSDSKTKSEIIKTNDVIESTIGFRPTIMRPPYGDTNKQVRNNIHMAEILWTVDTLDWKTRDPDKIFKSVKKKKKLDGQIILMHSIYDETAEASEKIIPWLIEEGYQLVTVSELVEYKTGSKPKEGKLYITVE